MNIYTIGHSTHKKETFLQMLHHLSIKNLIDIRAFPGSRKFPSFSKENMQKWVTNANIDYYHLPKLGGRRRPSGDVGITLNNGWNNDSFHNYADYTLSEEFREGIHELTSLASKNCTAYFCAERHPSRCHRLLVSNWLQVKGWNVKHIIDKSNGEIEIVSHELGKWGAMPIIEDDGFVVYPEI